MQSLIRFFLFSLVLYSCRDEEKASFEKIETGTTLDLNQVYCKSDSEIIIAGGNTWFQTLVKFSTNKGSDWTESLLSGRSIFSLCSDRQNNVYACGLDQKIYLLDEDNSKQFVFGDYAYLRGIDAWSSHHIMLAGGESFQIGYIYRASIADSTWTKVFEFDRELNLIHCIDSMNWLAAGFGIILRTENAGYNWDTLETSGDHFYDVSFVNDRIAYMCGIGGSILKTSDKGKNWKTIRDAKKAFVSSKPFRCICFADENRGIVAGESGLVWKSTDGGKNWSELIDLPCENYNDIDWDGSHFWLTGSKGILIRLD